MNLKIDGKTLDGSLVLSIVAGRDVSAPGFFELCLKYSSQDGTILSDHEQLTIGNRVEITAEPEDQSVMVGEITGLELDYCSGARRVIVRGHDLGHRLLRGRKTRSFTHIKDSDIAGRVAQEAGLDVEAEDTRVRLEYVLQHNQTDWELLQQRARDLGFEVRVDDERLIFQRHKNDSSKVLILEEGKKDLVELRPRLSTVGLVGEVVVQGWSPKDKEAVTGRASSGDEGTTMGGSQGGLAVARKKFDKPENARKEYVVDRPVLSQAEADQIALGRLQEMALSYVTGEGLAIGRADLKAGTVIEIDGFGTRFSGLYYLPSVCHTYTPEHGYRTAFTVRRNAT